MVRDSISHIVMCGLGFLLSTAIVSAADWPQYRGPLRDDVSTETGLLKTWPKNGPPLLWTFKEAGIGYAGPAVVGTRLYTLGGRGTKDVLIALDLGTASEGKIKEAWSIELGPLFEWKGNNWSAGSSATPTVSGDLIFAVGGFGDLVCVDTSGKERWRMNMPKELDAQVNPIGGGPKNIGWGFTAAPLVDGEQLICVPGGPKGTLAALDKETGRVRWRSTEMTDQAAYTSPMLAVIDDIRQYVLLTNKGLCGIAAKDGKLLWRAARTQAYGTEVVNSPLVDGRFFHTTVGAGGGCELVKVTKEGDSFKAETVYSNKNLANHHGNTIKLGEHVYGHSQGRGWLCQNFKDGTVAWEEKSAFPAGAMVYADERFYLYSENDGSTALLEASSKAWNVLGRFKLPEQSKLRKPAGRVWTPPIIANGKLYLRDQELLFCFDVKAK